MVKAARVSIFLLAAILGGGGRGTAVNAATYKQVPDANAESPENVVRLLAEQRKVIVVPSLKATVKQALKEDASSFGLPNGPSRVLLFQLPEYSQPYTLTLSSLCKCFGFSKSIFVPSALFFDAEFRETRQLPETEFRNDKPGMTKGYRLETTIVIDDARKADRFLLLFTNAAAVGRDQGTFVAGNGSGAATVGAMKLLHLNGVKRSVDGTIELETKPKK
jgi:hypothetical protein